MTRSIYSDESDTSGKGHAPIFTVAAVIVEVDRQLKSINTKMRGIYQMLRRDSISFEFKASRMFSHFRKFGDDSKYKAPMIEFLELMRLHQLKIRSCAVDRTGFKKKLKRSKPNDFAFLLTAIGVESWFADHCRSEMGLWFADPSRRDTAFADIIDHVRKFGVPELHVKPFEYFPETIAYMNSQRSVGIQMADFANFFLRMHLLKEPLAEEFFQIIQPFYGDKKDYEHVWYR